MIDEARALRRAAFGPHHCDASFVECVVKRHAAVRRDLETLHRKSRRTLLRSAVEGFNGALSAEETA